LLVSANSVVRHGAGCPVFADEAVPTPPLVPYFRRHYKKRLRQYGTIYKGVIMRKLIFIMLFFIPIGLTGNNSLAHQPNIYNFAGIIISNHENRKSKVALNAQKVSQVSDSEMVGPKARETLKTKSNADNSNSPGFVERVFGGTGAVNKLRRFRDELLGKSPEGREYIKAVYDLIPSMAIVMIRNGDVRSRTSANLKEIVPLVVLSLDKKAIEPGIGVVLNKLLDDYRDAKESSDYLKNEIQRMKEERPIIAFISRFNATDFGTTGQSEGEKLSPNARKYLSDTVLVKFNSGAKTSRINAICSEVGMTVEKHFKRIGLYKMRVPENIVLETIEKLSKYDEIQYAEPDYVLKILDKTPNDPAFNRLWGLHNTGQDGGTADADIDAPEAWGITTGNMEIVVCVIDTGVNYDHEDLSSNMWVNKHEIPDNNVDDDGNGYIDDYLGWDFYNGDNDPMDDHDHGTHCSGTIGGIGNNAVGVAGVNWTVKIMPLKFLSSCGSGATSDAVEAILYSTMMGAMIASNSWGGADFSQALYDAIEDFGNEGGLFIAAAGNDSADNDETPHYPSSYDLPNIISVAATDRNDALADFSNYGLESVDVAAPGVEIYSTVISGYDTFSGTSMATPHVAGVAALVKAKNPSWEYAAIKVAIEQGVETKASLIGKIATAGRINAYQALLRSACPDCPPDGVITNVTYFPGTICSCNNATSITIGPGVTIKNGATVTFKAPRVIINNYFHAESGALVRIMQE